MQYIIRLTTLLVAALLLVGCYGLLPSKGGGQLSYTPQGRTPDPEDVLLPEGYRIEVVADGLTFPTAVAFDGDGTPHVIEAGYSYGEVFLQPKLLRIGADGDTTLVYAGERNGPWNGITFDDGYFYIAEGGQLEGGKILQVSEAGTAEILVENLPSLGDHHTNGPVVRDGYVYFGQGTATNAAVVGTDNAAYGWLHRFTDFHDIPCEDITVRGVNSTTENVLTDEPDDEAVTGPYSPYGETVQDGQVIPGAIPCGGAVLRVPVDGGEAELVAWGFRNPYGLALDADGALYVTDNMYDVRGSRPAWGTGDLLWKVEEGSWYGWPDYYSGIPVASLEFPGKNDPQRILAEDPGAPAEAVAKFGVHASANGLDFSPGAAFGFAGQAFVAEFGDMAPTVGKALAPVGYKVVRVDVKTGVVADFAVNNSPKNGPASWLRSGGLERPVSVSFDPAGDALYVVDFGILTLDDEQGPMPREGTGVVWKITKTR
ncbi:hypothetical protein CLV84_2533 [Neolewinella xylanilytica]|uniref:Glucose/arabinose dehydrogenase n=1 Tax=Neolewinella xylanilytica TaxID=1514080 RepID=A0A2S6I399_9BACT|nr:PQQ-dependent sugar dehydrogenase [Neolewinella xylanilytica]PPK85630.1 hypothetical protein CLV84_2533 [Neolewinella xylanilytica]